MSATSSVLPLRGTTRENVSERVRQLQAEAKRLGREHIALMAADMADLQELAAAIADGGEAYSVGAREMARSLADDLDARLQTLAAIQARSR